MPANAQALVPVHAALVLADGQPREVEADVQALVLADGPGVPTEAQPMVPVHATWVLVDGLALVLADGPWAPLTGRPA